MPIGLCRTEAEFFSNLLIVMVMDVWNDRSFTLGVALPKLYFEIGESGLSLFFNEYLKMLFTLNGSPDDPRLYFMLWLLLSSSAAATTICEMFDGVCGGYGSPPAAKFNS